MTLSLALVAQSEGLPNLWELTKSGGPLMWPLGICSVVALAYTFERWTRLSKRHLDGDDSFGRSLVAALDQGGPSQALAVSEKHATPMGRIMTTALRNAGESPTVREKRVEDAAAVEVDRLLLNLKPLLLVYLVAPLLGLLGTVWGLIEAFATIAMKEGLGRPELLAAGVYQALVTTAAGLTIAIPVVVVYMHLKNRIDRFSRRTEALYVDVEQRLSPHAALPAPPALPPERIVAPAEVALAGA